MRVLGAAILGLALVGCERPQAGLELRPDEVLLQVAATGRADARPTEARFVAGVDTQRASAREAGQANAEAMNRVLAALRELGIAAEDVQTRTLTLQRIDYGPERGRFRATNQVSVRVRDVGRAGAAVAAVTEAGANVLSGPDLSLGDPEAAANVAYAAAYRAARARADAYAKAAGLRVGRVLAIRDGAVGPGPTPVYTRDATDVRAQSTMVSPPPIAAAPPPPGVYAGQSASVVQVYVDFALAD